MVGDLQRPLSWQRPQWIQQPFKVVHAVEFPPPVAQGRSLCLQLLYVSHATIHLPPSGGRSGSPTDKRGVTQGYPLSLVIYYIIISVLVQKIWWEYPGFLQSWYADLFSTVGAGSNIKPDIYRIESLETVHGLFIEP